MQESAIALDTDYPQAEGILRQYERFGVELGLERIQRLLAALGHPHQSVPIIHVAGSNGKGSVCACLSAMLSAAGYRVGRYTSPHLVSWCERICINDEAIAPDVLRDVLQRIQPAVDPAAPSPTQFEMITAAAWLHFAEQSVDVAVMEVGLGGRLDATNVCDRPLVTVITSLSREHWQRLGPTLTDIAREKAGILKPNCPVVVGPLPPDVESVVQQRAISVGCPVISVAPARADGEGWALYETPEPLRAGSVLRWRYPIPLAGAHQRNNVALAIAVVQVLQGQGWQISLDQMEQGLRHVRWPARMQWLQWHGCRLLVDGAHNAAGAIALRQYVDDESHHQRLQPPFHWVMGFLATKDHAEMLRALLRPGDRVWFVPVSGHATAQPEDLATIARTICPESIYQVCETPLEGLWAAAHHACQGRSPTLILCGSLYLIGSVLQLDPLNKTKLPAPDVPLG